MKRPRAVTCICCGVEELSTSSNYKRCTNCRKRHLREYGRSWYGLKKGESENFLKKRADQAKKTRRENPEKRLLLGAKQRARDAGLPFDLELADILIPDLCPILNVSMEIGGRHGPSLDRFEPDKGYVKGNVWVISRKANVMKNDATPEELRSFSEWVQRTYRP